MRNSSGNTCRKGTMIAKRPANRSEGMGERIVPPSKGGADLPPPLGSQFDYRAEYRYAIQFG